jgi:hypothetical protein
MDVRYVPCPVCGESIHPIAGRCKYCRADVIAARRATATPEPAPLPNAPARRWPKRLLAVAVVAGAAVLGAIPTGHKRDTAVAQAAAAQPAAEVARPKPGPYVTVAGTWKGIGYQYDIRTSWDVVMKLDADDVAANDKVGTIEYPTMGCKGQLLREREDGNTFVVIEEITTNPGNACVPRGRIKFERKGDELDWRYYFLMDPREAASAKLSR